jgi:hypothetical protein
MSYSGRASVLTIALQTVFFGLLGRVKKAKFDSFILAYPNLGLIK